MSPEAAPMPSIQGETMELFTRVPPLPTYSSRVRGSRGTQVESPPGPAAASTRVSGRRPSTSAGDGRRSSGGPMVSQLVGMGAGGQPDTKTGGVANAGEMPQAVRPASRGEDTSRGCKGDVAGADALEESQDTNVTNSKLLGGYLRGRLLANITSDEPAKELVKRSFRHLHRGQGHVLTLDEFKEGLSNTFGAPIPLPLIHATFDVFDTEPKTWQLDFDEFCHWLDTGERVLNGHGTMKKPIKTDAVPTEAGPPPKARKPRSNDTSGEFKSSASNCNDEGMSMEQVDREKLKAHLLKHRTRLHKPSRLTEAQKSVLDHILMDNIKARRKRNISETGSLNGLENFKAFSGGNGSIPWLEFKKQVTSMLPHLHDESEIKEAFSRMDHDGDGVVDLTDFLMWEERMQEGRANTDFWALEEEDHLEQIKAARNKASNLLVPDDYDGSTYHANLSREIAQKTRAEKDAKAQTSVRQANADIAPSIQDEHAQALRDKCLSKVKGGSLEMIKAFRHFRPAAAGRRLFLDYTEFRESIKEKGLGLEEEDIKAMFAYFDVDGSGEIDFSEFRRFLEGGIHKTGLEAAGARLDQLLKAKVLRRIAGGQSEVLRALRGFGADGSKANSGMDYPCFAKAIGKSGFALTEPEAKQIFNELRICGPSGEDKNGVPMGQMSLQAFREWLLESHTSTSLDVGKIIDATLSEDQVAEQISIFNMHKALRAKVVNSFESDHRNLLRAFRGVTRKKGSVVTARDLREALSSFGVSDDRSSADRLFKLYDWRNNGSIRFQELMEIVTGSDSPPRRLTSSERFRRLEDERRLPEEAIQKVEDTLRRALWKKYLDNAEGCYRAITGGTGRTMGLEGLQTAVRVGGVGGEEASDVVLKQVMQRHAGPGREISGWSVNDFVQFYRPADCRAAMALARERDGEGGNEEDLKRTASIKEGNRARTELLKQVRRLSQTLKAADKGTPVRSGRVSRKTFAKALEKEGGLGRVGEAELTRLLARHGCSEQGGSYVNYPVFVESFTSAVIGAEPASVVAAVEASKAASAAAAASAANKSSEAFPGTVSGTVNVKRRRGSGESSRSKSNPHLALLPPRPHTAAVSAAGETGEGKATAQTNRGAYRKGLATPPADCGLKGGTVKAATPAPNGKGDSKAVHGRAQTAAGSRRQTTGNSIPETKGYFKRFIASGGEIDLTPLKVSKSAPSLPDLVGHRPEVPKTTPIHRVMKRDVAKSVKDLRKAFKQYEYPYRRGVVSVEQFKAVCLKHGVTVDKEDVDFLLRLHRHKIGGGKYAIPPKWVQAPPPGAPRDTSKEGVRYEEFLHTCLSATSTEVSSVAAS